MRPWTRGYVEFKLHEIARVLRRGDFRADQLPAGYGFRLDERIVEYPWFFSRLPAAPGLLLDAGSILNFEFLLEQPALQNKRLHICTLAPEPECFWHKGVSYLFDDLRRLPYRDGVFDWAVSISTLEHVGMDNTLLYTARPGEKGIAVARLSAGGHRTQARVLKPGGTLYATVPFGRARDHGWLQIFDQPGIEDLIGAFGPAACTREYFLYHPEGWRRSTAPEAGDATFLTSTMRTVTTPISRPAPGRICCPGADQISRCHPFLTPPVRPA